MLNSDKVKIGTAWIYYGTKFQVWIKSTHPERSEKNLAVNSSEIYCSYHICLSTIHIMIGQFYFLVIEISWHCGDKVASTLFNYLENFHKHFSANCASRTLYVITQILHTLPQHNIISIQNKDIMVDIMYTTAFYLHRSCTNISHVLINDFWQVYMLQDMVDIVIHSTNTG
jgi:hypothetical protein